MSDNSPMLEPADVSQQIALIREQWSAVTRAMITACRGDADAAQRLAPFLDEMEQKEDWRVLTGVLRRILAGERRASVLFDGLDDTDTLIAGDILSGLGVNVSPVLEGEGEGDEHGDMISLEDFLKLVAQACQPNAPAGLAEQLLGATHGMAMQDNLPPELRELGRVLNEILSGERSPDLSTLPEELAGAVRALLTDISG